MKLNELKMDDWNGTYTNVANIDGLNILLLNITTAIALKEDGRRNLLSVDKDFNIIWLAEPPTIARSIGYFMWIKYLNGKLDGWYGGDVHITIDPSTGKLLSEEFIK